MPGPGRADEEDLCPDPTYKRYYSDHINHQARTNRLWEWWRDLPPKWRNKITGYVYRTYPPLIDPPPESKTTKYIDVVTEYFDGDVALCDRYGAGDYRVYVNISEKKPRTLAECYIKGNRDFKSQPPSDRRITEVDEKGRPKWIDVNDPQCRSYVEFLRTRGLMPEVWEAKREHEMAEQADVLKSVLSMNRDLVEKATSKREEGSTPLHETVGRVIDTAMSGARAGQEILKETIQTLQEQLSKQGGSQSDSGGMKMALQIAELISKQSDPAPYMAIIAKLNETVAGLQLDRLNDKIDALRSSQGAGSPTASLRNLIEDFKAVQELVGESAGSGPKMPGWLTAVTALATPLSQMVGNLTQAFIASRMQPGMAGPPQPVYAPPPAAPMQPMQPAPSASAEAYAPPQAPPAPIYRDPRLYPNQEMVAPQPAAPPQPAPAGVDPLMMLLAAIQAPLLNQLRDGLGGDDFCDWFIGGYGEQTYSDLMARASQTGRQSGLPAHAVVSMMLDSYPPLANELAREKRSDVERFVREFCEFNASEYDAKRGRDNAADASAA